MIKTTDFDAEIKKNFELLGCAQLYDAAMEYSAYLDLGISSRTSIKKMAGPVFPVVTDNDMLPCLQALDAAPRGSVLLVHNLSEQSEALAGDIFVTAAKQQGLEGLIVNGAVRDLDEIEHMGFPVFSKTVTFVSAKTAKTAAHAIPASISLNGVNIEPMDWIFADSSGFLHVKKSVVKTVYKAGMMLRNREEELRRRIVAGERLSELCGLHDYINGRAPLKFEA